MENRNGLVVGATVTQATGTAEREAAPALIDQLKPKGRITLGADKAYDVRAFVKDLRTRTVTPHIARNVQRKPDGTLRRSSAIDGRTTRHPGYATVCASASVSRRCSAGSRPPPGCAKPATRVPTASIGSLPSTPPPTT